DNRYKAETFLHVVGPTPFWVETDFRTPVADWFQDAKLAEVRKKVATRNPAPAGVMVSEEEGAGNPHQPAAGDKKPRLVVLGSTTHVSNIGMGNQPLGREYDLFQSILGWLRDRPADIGIEAKKQDVYAINPRTNFDRMLYLPFFLMAFGVIGLGAAVWV